MTVVAWLFKLTEITGAEGIPKPIGSERCEGVPNKSVSDPTDNAPPPEEESTA